MSSVIRHVQGDRRPVITVTLRDRADTNADPQDEDTWPVVDLSSGVDGVRVDYYQGSEIVLDVDADATADTFTKVDDDGDNVAHGLENGDRVRFSASGSLPTGLTENTLYYVVAVDTDNNTFQVSTSSGGSAVDISDTGSGQISVIKQFDTATGTLVGDGSGGQFTFTHPALVWENPGTYEVEYVVRWTAGKETVYYRDTAEIRSK